MHRITRIVLGPEYRLRLTFDDGLEGVVDFFPTINKGGVFRPLRDPEFFATVSVNSTGRVLSWPGELEFCADSLWQDVRSTVPQHA